MSPNFLSPLRHTFLFAPHLFVIFTFIQVVGCFIPATPSNNTVVVTLETANSSLSFQWNNTGPLGFNAAQFLFSHELIGINSTGSTKGAFVQFSEVGLKNDSTTTPWIAAISCDTNTTESSEVDDIFTLAKKKGCCLCALIF